MMSELMSEFFALAAAGPISAVAVWVVPAKKS
jgi:hypothetical protein